MANCIRCEGLMLAAIHASRTYRDLLAGLESARIRDDAERSVSVQRLVSEAMRNRDHAMRALNTHEHTHARGSSR